MTGSTGTDSTGTDSTGADLVGKGSITDEEIDGVIAYIKSLGN